MVDHNTRDYQYQMMICKGSLLSPIDLPAQHIDLVTFEFPLLYT